MYRRRKLSLTAILTLLILILGLAAIAYFRNLAIYITIIAIGLSLALQKYVASYFGYYVIRFSHIFSEGDRIRIGTVKGDVRNIGLLHFSLDEVGEDEKLGGELTGRVFHVPNLIVLDQPVLNYSLDYSVTQHKIRADYVFDEVRIPLTIGSDIAKASQILENIIKSVDKEFIEEAKVLFKGEHPNFLEDAVRDPRILIHLEPQRIWLKGKFVSPVKVRNDLKTKIYLEFLKNTSQESNIHLA